MKIPPSISSGYYGQDEEELYGPPSIEQFQSPQRALAYRQGWGQSPTRLREISPRAPTDLHQAILPATFQRSLLETHCVIRRHERQWVQIEGPPPGDNLFNEAKIREEVLQASKMDDPMEAARAIDQLWEGIDEINAFAETKMRLLVKRLRPLPLKEKPPAWLGEELRQVSKEISGGALRAAQRLICATLAAWEAVDLTAELSENSLGAVEVSWQTPSRLTWLVYPPKLPWPGVHVRAYAEGKSGQLVGRTFHLAHRVVEYSKETVGAL